MTQRGHQARPTEQTQRSFLGHIDYHCVIGIPVADERDDTAVASRRPLHGAVVAADRERAHGYDHLRGV